MCICIFLFTFKELGFLIGSFQVRRCRPGETCSGAAGRWGRRHLAACVRSETFAVSSSNPRPLH